jgi:hypothetical protein
MSFRDLLRNARSGRASILHKFLTSYDPGSDRVYAFVEGHADIAFYQAHIQRLAVSPELIYFYNCEGKRSVFEAYRSIVARYPTCRRVLVFVDKDIDDLTGVTWPFDPRIFVTDVYSVENYCVCEEALLRYLRNFVKVRGAEINTEKILESFRLALQGFHLRTRCLMAWVISIRRSGAAAQLNDVDLSELFIFVGDGHVRRKGGSFASLRSACKATQKEITWRVVRQTCEQLSKLPPKTYTRGKFEAWWFVEFVRRASEQLILEAKDAGGSVSIYVPIRQNTLIQLLADAIQTPSQLEAFLRFHLASPQQTLDLPGPDESISMMGKMRAALGL